VNVDHRGRTVACRAAAMESGRSVSRIEVCAPTVVAVVMVGRRAAVRIKVVVTIVAVVLRVVRHLDLESDPKAIRGTCCVTIAQQEHDR
jgi:hypothetical protein